MQNHDAAHREESGTQLARQKGAMLATAQLDRSMSVPGDAGTAPSLVHGQAASRLRVAGLSCAALVVTVLAVTNLTAPGATERAANAAAVATVVVSLLVAALASKDAKLERVRALAVAYEILGAIGIVMTETYATYDVAAPVRGVSWVCLWITLFPMVFPATPTHTFVVSSIAATAGAGVVALTVGRAAGAPWLLAVLPNYAAAGLAVLFSRVIYNLGAQVQRAREMGSYELVERLGSGGMGEVWRARHRMLAQPAAIKLVRPEVIGRGRDPTILFKRFEREARVTAMLSSPHTVQLFDFGRTADGTLFYVMELLDGVDLQTLVERHGPLPLERVIHFLRQICESLAEAHERGLVHRDIKPANVYTCRLGTRHDCIKVLDFGLVAIIGDGEEAPTAITADDVLAGTPAFMAPEAVTRRPPPDHRVDIYALGCVGYWLVSGSAPFEGATPLQLVFAHISDDPEALSERLGAAIDATFEDLVMRCLAKDPEGRPQTARDVIAALDACIISEPWTEARAQAWWRDHDVIPPPRKSLPRGGAETLMPLRWDS